MRHALLVLALLTAPLSAQERLVLEERTFGAVASVRYSADGSSLAVAHSSPSVVRIYPLSGSRPVTIADGYDGLTLPAFTPDGTKLLCRSRHQFVRLYDAATGQELPALGGTHGTQELLGNFAVSADQRQLALTFADGTLRLLDAATLRDRHVLQGRGLSADLLTISRDGRLLASSHYPGLVRVWSDGKEIDSFDLDLRQGAARLTFSPDNSLLAVTTPGHTWVRDLKQRVRKVGLNCSLFAFAPDSGAITQEGGRIVWRDRDGRSLRSLTLDGSKNVAELTPAVGGAVVVRYEDNSAELHEATRRPIPLGDVALAVTPDGRTLVCAGKGQVRFLDPFGKELTAAPEKFLAEGTARVTVSPDGRLALIDNYRGAGRLWDVPGRRPLFDEWKLPLAAALSFSRDGRSLTALNPTEQRLERWDTTTGKRAAPGPKLEPRVALALSGDRLAISDSHGRLQLTDLAAGTTTQLHQGSLSIGALEFAPDGKLLATLDALGNLQLWDTATGRRHGEPLSVGKLGEVLVYSPDGKRLFTYSRYAGGATLVDVQARTLLALEGASVFGSAGRPHFSADSKALHLPLYGGSRRTWDVATGKEVVESKPDPKTPTSVLTALVSPDGRHVAASLSNGSVHTWPVSNPGADSTLLDPLPLGVRGLSFSPDGRLLAIGREGEVVVCDVVSGKQLFKYPQPGLLSDRLTFAPDGKALAVESEDGTVLMLNLDSAAGPLGKLRFRLTDVSKQSYAGRLNWSPDGSVLAVVTKLKTPRILDPVSGRVRHALPVQANPIRQMGFAADNTTLIVQLSVGDVSAWNAATGKRLPLPKGVPTSVKMFAAARGRFAFANDTHLALWSGTNEAALNFDVDKYGQVTLSADGNTAVLAGEKLRWWRKTTSSWSEFKPAGLPEAKRQALAGLAPDGRTALVFSGEEGLSQVLYLDLVAGKTTPAVPPARRFSTPLLVSGQSPLILERTRAGTLLLSNPFDPARLTTLHSPRDNAIATSPTRDGRTVLSMTASGVLRWHPADRPAHQERQFETHKSGLVSMALSPNDRYLAGLGQEAQLELHVWDIGPQPKLLLSTPLTSPTLSSPQLSWSADGKKVTLALGTGELVLCDAVKQTATTLQRGPKQYQRLSLARDGKVLAVQEWQRGQGTLRVFETRSGKVLVTAKDVNQHALSPDGNWLAAVSPTGTTSLYDVQSGKEPRLLREFQGLTGGTWVLFSPDSKTLAVGGRDGKTRHWSLTRQAVGTEFPSTVSAVFSGDSRRWIGYNPVGTVTVWDAASGAAQHSWPVRVATRLSASVDGKLVLTWALGMPAQLCDVSAPTAEPVTIFKEGLPLQNPVLTSDGKIAVAAFGTQVRFWDVAGGVERLNHTLRSGAMRDTPMLSDDGRWLVLQLHNGFSLWDVPSGQQRALLNVAEESSSPQLSALSGDGTTLAVTHFDGALRVYDVKVATETQTLKSHARSLTAVAVSSDGKTLVSAGEDRTVRLYSARDPSSESTTLRGPRSAILSLAVAPAGDTIAAASAEGSVWLWPTLVGKRDVVLRGHTQWSYRLTQLPNRRVLSSGTDGLRLWDLETGRLLRAFGTRHGSFALGATADGKRCLTGEYAQNGIVHLYDLDTGAEVKSFRGHTGYVWVTLFLPGETTILTGATDGKLLVWDVATGEKLREFEATGDISRCGAVSPNGRWLATGDARKTGKGGTIRIWDLKEGKSLRSFGEYPSEVTSVAWSPDGKRLLATAFDRTIRVWDPDQGKEQLRLTQPTAVDAAAWLPDGKRLLSTAHDGDNLVRLWDSTTGKELRQFTGHAGPPISVAVAPDGQTALTTSKEGHIRQWCLGSLEPTVLRGHEGEVWSVAFSPDGKLLATASADRTVRLWKVSGELVRKLDGCVDDVFSVAFSPDGKRLATGEGDLFRRQHGLVRLWDVASGEQLATLKGHTGAVRAVAFSPDGKLLASGGTDRAVRLWDARSGKSVRVLTGQTTGITALAFDRVSGLLASAGSQSAPGEPGEVVLWDVTTGKQRGPLIGHRAGVTGVAFSSDGTKLYSVGHDEAVRVWSLATGDRETLLSGVCLLLSATSAREAACSLAVWAAVRTEN